MFSRQTYVTRRQRLRREVGSGLIVLLGNEEVGMSYADNPYPFRQDSSFLYFLGIDRPGLAALLDPEAGVDTLYGDDPTLDDIVWMGDRPKLAEQAERVGVGKTGEAAEELAEIERAVEISAEMHLAAMRMARPGLVERQVAAEMERVALAAGGRLAFPTILTMDGETLHNHSHDNVLNDGRLLLTDAGAEAPSRYAADLSRTFPVGERFSTRQREVYEVALAAHEAAIAALRPGARFLDVHREACRVLTRGLGELGLMRGDPEEAVAQGAHALFFPCGTGHMLGLDVHDMEDLGEERVGYGEGVERSGQFGLASLRLARALRPGFVLTVEPGIYFIDALIDRWRAEDRHSELIDYERLEAYRGFGGLRSEEDFVITETGFRRLGPPVPKTVEEVETVRAATLG